MCALSKKRTIFWKSMCSCEADEEKPKYPLRQSLLRDCVAAKKKNHLQNNSRWMSTKCEKQTKNLFLAECSCLITYKMTRNAKLTIYDYIAS